MADGDRSRPRHRHRSRRVVPAWSTIHGLGPPRAAARPPGRWAELATPAARRGARSPRHRRLLVAPGRGHRPPPRRSLGGRRHRHRVGQVARATRSPSPRRSASRSSAGTALLLFPTKALAQDQLRAFGRPRRAPTGRPPPTTATRAPKRATWVRRHANVMLTNPEMLHVGILPHHARWATFLMRLRYVVVDELHAAARASSAPTSAHLLRRLRRLCAHYGADPTFVFSLGHHRRARPPGRRAVRPRRHRGHRRRLATGRAPGRAVEPDRRRAPVGRRRPTRRPGAERPPRTGRPPASSADLVESGHRTIAFCRSRKGTEVVAADVRRRLPATSATRCAPTAAATSPPSGARSSSSCSAATLRGGGRHHRARARASTSAASTPACSTASPAPSPRCGSRPAGPAARASSRVAVLVAGDDQLDQWLMAHPTEVFSRPPEPAVVNPANPSCCYPTSRARPTSCRSRPDDERWWPELLDDGVRRLVLDDRLKLRPRRGPGPAEPVAFWAAPGGPLDGVGLRSGRRRRVPHRDTPTARSSAPSTGPEPSRWSTPARSTCTRARPSGWPSSTSTTRSPSSSPPTAASTPKPAPRPSSCLLAVDDERSFGSSSLGLGPVRGAIPGDRLPALRRRSPASCSATTTSTFRRASS